MNTETHTEQTIVGTHNWQSWLVLRHFLPARLQREMVRLAISVTSNDTVNLEAIFDEVTVKGPIWNECWLIRPKPHSNRRLIQWTRNILWQNDHNITGPDKEDENYSRISLLYALTRLAFSDTRTINSTITHIRTQKLYDGIVEPNIHILIDAFEIATQTHSNVGSFWESTCYVVEQLALPLRAITIKHLGDLHADADQWKFAIHCYEKAQELIYDWHAPLSLDELKSSWIAIMSHSIATATIIIDSPEHASRHIDNVLQKSSFDHNTLLEINTTFDAHVLRNQVSPQTFSDNRSSFLQSPLLLTNHHADRAIKQWLRGDYNEASRSFWALLRRQIALGAAAESRETKAWYAQSILEGLSKRKDSTHDRDSFSMAIRLLIESEYAKEASQIDWNRSLVNSYVTDIELVKSYDAHATTFDGAEIARVKVIIELYMNWVTQLQSEFAELAQWMWRRIADIALTYRATFNRTDDIGRPALKALQVLAQYRPEWAPYVAPAVTKALSHHIRSEFRWGQQEAIEAGIPYATIGAFESNDIEALSIAVLEALESEDPKHNFWPLIRPAFAFLLHPKVRDCIKDDEVLDKRCLDQILRFGLQAENEQGSLPFWLANFDDSILENANIQRRLKAPIDYIRNMVEQINSSNVTHHVRALLVAPAISGTDGVADALNALLKILGSANSDRRSLGLPWFDGPLMSITEQLDILRHMPNAAQKIEPLLKALIEQLETVWNLAWSDPLIFAGFAIPSPSRPNKVLVHNCAFASLRFAHRLGESDRIQNALNRAAENQELADSISMAKATHASGAEHAEMYLDDSLGNSSSSFYKALGRRLVQLQHLPSDKKQHLCEQLLDYCLRFGPRPEDAAVFTYVLQLESWDPGHLMESDLNAYEQRVQRDADTRLLLSPLLGFIRTKTKDGSQQ